jgi:hypothetical protein
MALIYTKLTDKTLVLAPREGICRKFNLGTDWTEIRVGVFLSCVSSAGSNVDNTLEIIVPSGITDYITFGIKDDSLTLPGQPGSLFLGIRSHDVSVVASSPPGGGGGFKDSAGTWNMTGYFGTSIVENTSGGGLTGSPIGASAASGSSAYCGFFCVKIIITNRGLSTQSVSATISKEDSVAGTDYSAAALRTKMNAANFPTPESIAWNTGAAARAIPDCIWLRSPLYDNAFRVSAHRAIRYAP